MTQPNANAAGENFILLSRPADRVLLVQLNRPHKRNALIIPMLKMLADALAAADEDDAIGAVVITGDHKAFCAGSDISEQHEKGTGHVFSSERLEAWRRVEKTRKPTIAAVNGYAFGGGCELMMLFDFAIAGDDAIFAMPEIDLGIFPGDGGTQRLPRIVGVANAKRMILSGERVGAARALAMNLVTEVVPAERALDRAVEVAAEIARKSPLALATAKDAIERGGEMSLEEGLALEQKNLALIFEGDSWKAGMAAFVRKSS